MSKQKSRAKAKSRPQRKRKQKTSRTAFYTLLAVVVVAGALYGGIQLLWQAEQAKAGTRVSPLPAEHLPACVPNYNSRPPTSGCHQPGVAGWGVYDAPIEPTLQVHNLEHGAVIVHYRPEAVSGVSTGTAEDLRAFVQELRQDGRYCKLILAPYPGLETAIALTAWGWIDTLEAFDAEAIRTFIDDHIGKEGPEYYAPC